MSDFYGDMSAAATELLAEFGKSLVLRRTNPGTYDPVTGRETGGSTDDLPTTGLYTKISADYIATHQVQTGDKLAVIDASQEPQMTDKLVDGANVWQVVDIDKIDPAGTPIAYFVRVRK